MSLSRWMIGLWMCGAFGAGLAVAVSATGCSGDTEPVFCDGEPDCGSGGSGAGSATSTNTGTNGTGGKGTFCGTTECEPYACVLEWACSSTKQTCMAVKVTDEGRDDHNPCTTDQCEPDGWKHYPLPQSEIDDGDPCTVDYCDESSGVGHEPDPACN